MGDMVSDSPQKARGRRYFLPCSRDLANIEAELALAEMDPACVKAASTATPTPAMGFEVALRIGRSR